MIRYLPKTFSTKVIIIGESKDLDTIKVDAFVGSLQNFEQSLLHTRRNKSMDLKSINEEHIDPSNDDLDDHDLDLKTINFLFFFFIRINFQFYYNRSWVLKMVVIFSMLQLVPLSLMFKVVYILYLLG